MIGAGRVLVVVGMKREARIVGNGLDVVVGRKGLAEALARRPLGVISFGLCGALDPALEVGDLVIGSSVSVGGERIASDEAWADRLIAALPGARRGEFAGSDVVVPDAAAKATLRRDTGAHAVDMESHLIVRTGLPFAVLRTVSDTAGRSLPSAAVAGFRADGGIDVGAVLRRILVRPAELAALLQTAREAGAAFRALAHARDLLGPGLACPYLGEHLVDVS